MELIVLLLTLALAALTLGLWRLCAGLLGNGS